MEDALRLHEFFIEGGNPEQSQVIVNITEPSTHEEQRKGVFFVLCELSGATPDIIEELGVIIEKAQTSYYQSTHEPEQALEQTLDLWNRQSISLQRPYIKAQCTIGVLAGNTILFAFCGKPIITLFYKHREGRYQELDLIAQNSEVSTPDTHTTAFLFTQLIQGKITSGDYLFIGSSHSQDALKGDQFRQLITTRNPKESALLIERGLRGLSSGRAHGGLILALSKHTPPVAQPTLRHSRHGSAQSLQHFFSTEQKTNETLSASLGKHIGNKLQSTIDTIHQPTKHNQPHIEQAEETNYIPPRARVRETLRYTSGTSSKSLGALFVLAASYSGKALLTIGSGAIGSITYVGKLLSDCVIVITNIRGRRTAVLDGWSRTWRGYKQHFIQLPLLTKLLFGLSVVLIVVFIVSIVRIRAHQARVTEERTFTEAIQAITNKLNSAEGALVYNNTASARNDITQAEITLERTTPSCQQSERSQTCAELKQRIASLMQKTRNIVMVDTTVVTTFSGFAQPKSVRINTLLMVYSANTSSIFTYNLLTKEAEYLSTTSTGFVAAAVPKENDYALFLANDGTLLTFNPRDKSFKPQSLSLPPTTIERAITGLMIYNRRLYSLDAGNGQIYRHETIRSGFATGKEWIKNPSLDTRGSIDTAIDGDVFILLPDGVLKKYTNGIAQDFPPLLMEPPLKKADRLYTYADVTNIYLLDTAEKRLIITDKNGKLVRQLMSEAWVRPTDMIIDEGAKNAYIVDTTFIYRVDLPL